MLSDPSLFKSRTNVAGNYNWLATSVAFRAGTEPSQLVQVCVEVCVKLLCASWQRVNRQMSMQYTKLQCGKAAGTRQLLLSVQTGRGRISRTNQRSV